MTFQMASLPLIMTQHDTTPPTLEIDDFADLACTGGSSSSASTYLDLDWSPQSILTSASTPPIPPSPVRIKECGPQLLPKVRTQDQIMDRAPTVARQHMTHMRAHSVPSMHGYPMQSGGHLPMVSNGMHYQSTAIPGVFDFTAPASAPAIQRYNLIQSANLAATTALPPRLSAPVTSVRSHSRNTSTGSIDASLVNKYRYPTYRQSPTPQPQVGDLSACTADALSHLTPIAMLSGGTPNQYAPRSRNVSPAAPPVKSRLSSEVELAREFTVQEQTCLKTYLIKPNPTPQPLRSVLVDRNNPDCFWFDVRNVYEWTDFTINTVLSFDGFSDLLSCSVDVSLLPEPVRVNLDPEGRAQLAELCANHHLYKLNRSLALSQGRDHHLAARALTTGAASRSQPEFVSNYHSESQKTIFGNGRGRVVGIVRGFEEWNSGMRGTDVIKKIEYCRGLAALHKQMREHGCRYGFIMSEIELVCVRAGGPDAPGKPPLFGFLELSSPISVSTHGLNKDGELQMTAGIALWYLHMLARDDRLPGQLDWRLNVGGLAAGTRQHHLKKDLWIPQPNQSEKRTAKRSRGWFMPDEPISSQERGRTSRRRA